MSGKNMSKSKEAVFFVESQPPHLGELTSVLLKIKAYDVMHICVSGIPQVMSVERALVTWKFLLDVYKDKITVSALLVNFSELPELPERFKNCTVLTTSTKVFVHMTSLDVSVELVPRVLGYHDIFQRTAYRQGRALDYLHSNKTQTAKHDQIKIKIKKE